MKTICIAGKNEIAVNSLKYIVENYGEYEIWVIPNQGDNGENSWQPSLRLEAQNMQIPIKELGEVYPVEDLIFISLEYDKIIRPGKFKSNQLYNIHFSKLPKYKGMFTSVMPILNGEKESGVTLHLIDRGIDTGDIIDQTSFKVGLNDTGRQLYQKYLDTSFTLLKENLDGLVNRKFNASAQPIEESSYYSKRTLDFSDIKIDFNRTAFQVHNQIRAFTFRDYQLPVVFNVPVNKSEVVNKKSDLKPGALVKETDEYFEIATIDYDIKVHKDYYENLWDSCNSGNLQNVKKILNLVPDIDLRNNKGWSALMISVYNNHFELSKWLIDQGSNPQLKNYKGTTVLMYALSNFENSGDDTLFDYIMSLNIDFHAKDDLGKNVLDYARERGVDAIVDKLETFFKVM